MLTHIFRRATEVLDEHTGNVFYYINTITNKGRPWGIFGIFSFIYILWLALKKKKEAIFLASWVLVIFGIFTLTRTKLPWYIIPIYPALAISAGIVTERILRRRWFVFLVLVITVVLVLGSRYRLFDLDLNREIKSLASTAKAHSSLKRGVYLYRISDPGVRFYFGDVFKEVEDESEIIELVTTTKEQLFLMKKEDYNAILPRVPKPKVLGTSNYNVLFTR